MHFDFTVRPESEMGKHSRWAHTKLKRKRNELKGTNWIDKQWSVPFKTLQFSWNSHYISTNALFVHEFIIRRSQFATQIGKSFENHPNRSAVRAWFNDIFIIWWNNENLLSQIVYLTQSNPWIAYIDLHPINCYEIVVKEEYFPDKFIYF